MIFIKKELDKYNLINNLESILKLVSKFIDNYHKLPNLEFYEIFSQFYDIELEDQDYLNIINKFNRSHFEQIKELDTNLIYQESITTNYEQDCNYFTEKFKLLIKVATTKELEDKTYTKEEIINLTKNKQIYPLIIIKQKIQDKEITTCHNYEFIDCFIEKNYGKIDKNSKSFNEIMNYIRFNLKKNELFTRLKTYCFEIKKELNEIKDTLYGKNYKSYENFINYYNSTFKNKLRKNNTP